MHRFIVAAEKRVSSPSTAFLALGSNRGRRWVHLQGGIARLNERDGVAVVEASPVYETEAHTVRPEDRQPAFLNAVIRIETTRSPEALLRIAREVERAEGRRREKKRWAPRSLDVDLLAYDEEVRDEEGLSLPHPRLDERRFVLQPWADVASNFVVPPPFDESVQALLEECPDTAAVERLDRELDASASTPPAS